MILNGHWTKDGAGVKLFRVFSHDTVELTDPFLLLDHFGSDNPDDYLKGFPWHPHRGIETVTYLLEGQVEHGDSIGNSGVIRPGEVQWMTAGSGILHQEMPKPFDGPRMTGLQLWVNLPRKSKMMGPRYRGLTKDDIPLERKNGADVRVISGIFEGTIGPVKDLVVDTSYLDISLKPGASLDFRPLHGYTTICYLLEGEGGFNDAAVKERQAAVFRSAKELKISAVKKSRFILASGRPLKEPVAWGGPIVMNTQDELDQAYAELQEGTFIKPVPEM
jgi:redox-sensitive bicupin YhaK (pirin superfamily)